MLDRVLTPAGKATNYSAVRTESLYERPIPERHRIIFYVGHLEDSTVTCWASTGSALMVFILH